LLKIFSLGMCIYVKSPPPRLCKETKIPILLIATLSDDMNSSWNINLFRVIQIPHARIIGKAMISSCPLAQSHDSKADSKVFPCQYLRVSIKILENSQTSLRKEHCKKICSIVSKCVLQRAHRPRPKKIWFCKLSQLGNLFSKIDQTKSFPFAGQCFSRSSSTTKEFLSYVNPHII